MTDSAKYRDLFQSVGNQASELAEKFESGNYTSRDLAVLGELFGKYIDGLDDLQGELKIEPTNYTVKVDGKTIKFRNEYAMSEFIADLMGDKNATI